MACGSMLMLMLQELPNRATMNWLVHLCLWGLHIRHSVLAGVKARHISFYTFKILLLYNRYYFIIIPYILEQLTSVFWLQDHLVL